MQETDRTPRPLGARARRLLGDWDVLSAVAVVVLAIGAAQLVGGAFAAGLSYDEPIHQDRAHAWVENGWYVPSYWQEDDEPDPTEHESTPWVYGPATAAFAHIVNVTVGNEALDDVASSAGSYDVRHLVVALLGALAVAAVGLAVWVVTRSPALGLWAAAAMLAVPRFTGHAFFNIKDVPAASGYTLLTVGLLFALLGSDDEPGSRRRRFSIAAAVGTGVLVGGGTRLSLWLPFSIALATYAALRLGQRYLGGLHRERATDVAVAGGAAAGFLGIAALYPNVARTPIDFLVESVSSSAAYPYHGLFLTAGELLTEHPPLWYLPAWLASTYPLLLGALALLGAVTGIRALLVARSSVWSSRDLGLVLVLQQALMLPVAVAVNGGLFYNGLRQHLYVLPAITILAGVGAWWLLGWARSHRPANLWRPAAVGALCMALVVPMVGQSLLFPYNYTYFNPIVAVTGGIEDRWETDYWWVSNREAVTRVPLGVPLRCSPYLADDYRKLPVEFEECDGDRFNLAEEDRATDLAREGLRGPPMVWVIGRKRAGNYPPHYCEEVDNVTRWMWGETLTLSYVLRCDPERVAIQDRKIARQEAAG